MAITEVGTNPSSKTANVTARYKIEISGKEVTQQSPSGLEALTVEDHVDMVGVAEMTFSAEGDSGLDWGSVKVGDEIKVMVGEGGTVTFTTAGTTVENDGAQSLLDTGEAAGVLMPSG